jgi:hypothetical protein
LEEKNLSPVGYQKAQPEFKGFLPETTTQDFLICGHTMALCAKWCSWEVKAIVTMLRSTRAGQIMAVLERISLRKRN